MQFKTNPSTRPSGAALLLFLALFLIQDAHAQCIIDVDFDNWNNQRYSIQNAFSDFNGKVKPWTASTYRGIESPGGSSSLHENTPQETRIVNGEIRAEYLKNEASGRNGGFLFDAYFDGEEEAYLEYTVRFEPGFEFWGGGKLPGLGGSTRGAGSEIGGNGAIPSGGEYNEDGFSARLMWRRNFNGGTVPTGNPYFMLYSYFSKRQNGSNRIPNHSSKVYGDNYRILDNITANTAYTIKQYVKLNTPGQSNGIVKVWVNGQLELNETNMTMRRPGRSDIKINALIMHTYRGGARYDSKWYTPDDEYAFFDDFKVWTGGPTPPCNGGSGGGQSAYNGPHNIPGQTQAEDYDNGGQGVAYNDSNTTNSGGGGRTNEGVDVANSGDVGGGLSVGWTNNGEWLEYTMANVQSGNYNIKFRVASNSSITKSIRATLDGQNLGTVSVPNTGGWNSWQDVSLNNVTIGGGSNDVLRLTINGGALNINHFTFTKLGGSGQSAFNGPHNIPGLLQVEDYDNGGQGVAYNDSNTTNSGGEGRTNEGVDLGNSGDVGGGLSLGWTNDGEWLEYTMANIQSGNYDIKFRVASNVGGSKSVNARLDGQNLGTVSVPNTGGWASWQDVSLNNVSIGSGSNDILRLTINGGAINLNHVTFTKLGSGSLEGTYRLVNVRSDRYLDSDGVNIKVGTSASGTDKQWELVNSAGANYNIDSKFSGRGVLEALNGGAIAGTSVQPVSTTNRREWTFDEVQPGIYLIENVDQNGYLAEVNASSSSAVEWTAWNGNRARWRLEPVGGSSLANNTSTPSEAVSATMLKDHIELFPNPTSDLLHIRGLGGGNAQIEVYSITGALLMSQNTSEAHRLSLDVTPLVPGAYVVKIKEAGISHSRRFIKQ